MQKKKIIILTVTIIAILVLLILSINVIRKQNKNKLNLSENVAKGTTIVEPNVPVLSAGMIPIKPNGKSWIITTQNDKNWYDYLNGQPAYMMLNDGYYKSELERGIEEEQLMKNSVGVGVPDDPQICGSIYMWIPRFAINEEGDIKYVNGIENAEENWTIPELFAYRQESETVPDFLLTGVWVAIDTEKNLTETIEEMNREDGKYGFIKNTIAVANDQTNQTAIQKYIVGNDAHVVPFNDISNPNRIILKIINQNYQDPIKAKGSYSKDTGLIEIQVTYSQYGISKIMLEETELTLTKNNNRAIATSEGIELEKGRTYKVTIIDNKGNMEELEIKVVFPIFVTLYTDGTLAFSNNSNKVAGKSIRSSYGDISEQEFKSYNSAPWYKDRASIKTVDILNKISPTSTENWFYHCSSLTTINNINNLDTSKVTSMTSMFNSCSSLKNIDLGNFDTSKVTEMDSMFSGCSSLSKIENMNKLDTSNVTIMTSMFQFCSALTSIDVSNFDTSNVDSMMYMFRKCEALTSIDLSNFDTSNVVYMRMMFEKCSALTSLDLSAFDTRNATSMMEMFQGCSKLKTIYVGENWVTTQAEITNMFKSCGTSKVTKK